MKKLFQSLTFFIVAFSTNSLFAQTIDTIYYNEQYKGVPIKDLAKYYRVYYRFGNSNYQDKAKEYYITGEFIGEGTPISIDRFDDTKSLWKGRFTSYYPDGKVQYVRNRDDEGRYEGEQIDFYENGLIKVHVVYKNGQRDGIYTEFSEDGNSCIQYEYKEGKISKPYYTYATNDGIITKYKVKDHTPYLEMPTINEKQTFYNKGVTWEYYKKNGITLMVNGTLNRDYGKYITLSIILSNHTNIPITFNPSLISAYKERKGKMESIKILEASEYMAKVANRQNWAMFFNAFNESVAASKAGYSTSSTQTSSIYGGQSQTGVVGAAIGTDGAAVGAAVGTSQYSGYNVSSSSTVNYNGAAAYQAQLIASGRIADYNSMLLDERYIKEEGYLKITTINPKESVSGYINIPYSKGEILTVNIVINSVVYPFSWNMSN